MELHEYKNVLGQTCNYMTISNILSYYGLNVPEEFVFLLLKGHYRQDMDINIPFFSKNAFNKIGFDLDYYQFNNKDEFKYMVEKIILERMPIIANVNSRELPYFPVNMNTVINHPHIIIIRGYKEGQVLVSDVYVPFYPPEGFTGWLDVEIIFKAISKSKDIDKLFFIRKSDSVNISIPEIFGSSNLRVIDMMLEENLIRRSKANDSNKMFEIDDGFNSAFARLSQKEVKEIARRTRAEWMSFEGPVQTRYFLEQVYTYMKDYHINYEKYAYVFKVFNERWNGIANAIIKFSVILNEDYFKTLSDLYTNLLEDEIEYMNSIRNEALGLE